MLFFPSTFTHSQCHLRSEVRVLQLSEELVWIFQEALTYSRFLLFNVTSGKMFLCRWLWFVTLMWNLVIKNTEICGNWWFCVPVVCRRFWAWSFLVREGWISSKMDCYWQMFEEEKRANIWNVCAKFLFCKHNRIDNIFFLFLKRICRAFVWMEMACIYRENALCTFVQKVRPERRLVKWLFSRGFVCIKEGMEAWSPALGSGAFFSMLREYSVTTVPSKVRLHPIFLIVVLRRFDCLFFYAVF